MMIDLEAPRRWIARFQLSRLPLNSIRSKNGCNDGRNISLQNRYTEDTFAVHGWRWHHLGIVRDLRRLSTGIQKRQMQLCPTSFQLENELPLASSARQQWIALQDMLNYILVDNWGLHNFVECKMFFPWLENRHNLKDEFHRKVFLKDKALIERQRALLARQANTLAKLVSSAAGSGFKHDLRNSDACTRTLREVRAKVDQLSNDAERLFIASEAVMVPRVISLFTRGEQLQFNNTVISSISGKQARISLVIFKHATEESPEDASQFQNGVPAPIRRLALPFWFKRFVAHKIRFIAEPHPVD